MKMRPPIAVWTKGDGSEIYMKQSGAVYERKKCWHKTKHVAEADTYEEFVAIAKARGYSPMLEPGAFEARNIKKKKKPRDPDYPPAYREMHAARMKREQARVFKEMPPHEFAYYYGNNPEALALRNN